MVYNQGIHVCMMMDMGTVEPPLIDTPFNEQPLYNKHCQKLNSLLRTLILVSKCSLYYGGYNVSYYCYSTSIGLYLTAYLINVSSFSTAAISAVCLLILLIISLTINIIILVGYCHYKSKLLISYITCKVF